MQAVIKKAGVLVEAIPYIHAFRQKLFVVKYGGSILENETVRKYVLEDIVFLSFVGIRIILVHGGGPHISARLAEAGKKSEFHEGIRVTDEETLKVVSEELDKLNKRIVAEIKKFKGDATGLKGEENIIHVQKKKASRDLGFVGTITSVDQEAIATHLKKGRIVVVSPMGVSVEKQPHNVNADEVASAIATSMKAEKLVALTDVQGVLREPGNSDTLISSMTIDQVNQLIASKIIQGGMIPKVSSCLEAVLGGVKKAHIVDARLQHALLLEIFTDRGVGTQILKE
ncbi:MAG TPA: acetylglutamate kinase [Candidatus Omnitrophota bacterium]|nr:acetylglutamate kinase [Candidatus Omnitrophota bacterium]HPD85344.1 acetylglutamate kinase [Candidatus Omnitrophota bacterium]HRZ04155.1 acetylglutamate kinase [Candidatus Omnitrophota bacterium]